MENINTPYDTNNTINNLKEMIGFMNPNWTQKIVLDIYLNDIQERHYKIGDYINVKCS